MPFSDLVKSPDEVAGAYYEQHVSRKLLQEGVQIIGREDGLVLLRQSATLFFCYTLSESWLAHQRTRKYRAKLVGNGSSVQSLGKFNYFAIQAPLYQRIG